MSDLEDLIRAAAQQPLNDAAFYALFRIKRDGLEESVKGVLSISHEKATGEQIVEAIGKARQLEQFCLNVGRDSLKSEENVMSSLQRARDENPDFTDRTYRLAEAYIRTGVVERYKDEEEEARDVLISGREWADIPYFRKPLFLAVLFLLFMPGYLLIIWTGDSFYRRDGVVYKRSLKSKRRMTACVVLLMASYFLRHLS